MLCYVMLCYVASVFEKCLNKAAAFFHQASETILRHLLLLLKGVETRRVLLPFTTAFTQDN